KEGFYGRRCASLHREYSIELSFRTRRYRDPLSDGRWRTKFFDTLEEAIEFEQQLAVEKAQRKAEKKSKERLKRWVGRLHLAGKTSGTLMDCRGAGNSQRPQATRVRLGLIQNSR
ncbi:MAG: hypothetical protein VYC14_08300, partial [Actinomycetota bacterium]|nr:hypothetical protein [Actinomycetota bacterium]